MTDMVKVDGNDVVMREYDLVMSTPVGPILSDILTGPDMVRFVRLVVSDKRFGIDQARRGFSSFRYCAPNHIRRALRISREHILADEDGNLRIVERTPTAGEGSGPPRKPYFVELEWTEDGIRAVFQPEGGADIHNQVRETLYPRNDSRIRVSRYEDGVCIVRLARLTPAADDDLNAVERWVEDQRIRAGSPASPGAS